MTINHSIPIHALWQTALGASLGLACSAGAWAAAGTVQFVAGGLRVLHKHHIEAQGLEPQDAVPVAQYCNLIHSTHAAFPG